MSAQSNAFAAKIRKTNLYLYKLIEGVDKIPAYARHEAALMAHVLHGTASQLSHKLRSHDYISSSERAMHPPMTLKKPMRKRTTKKAKRK